MRQQPVPDEEILTRAYIPMARHLAGRLWKTVHTRGVTYDDLLSDALLGLLRAVRTYDPGRKAPFQTHAYCCIWNRMIEGLRTWGLKMRSGRSRLCPAATGQQVKFEHASQVVDLTASSAIAGMENREYCDHLIRWSLLSVKEVRILRLRFWGGYQQREISRIMGCSPAQVSMVLKGALAHLRERLVKQGEACA